MFTGPTDGKQSPALVINRAPEVMHLAVDCDADLVEVPLPVPEASHPAHPLAADVSRKHQADAVPP